MRPPIARVDKKAVVQWERQIQDVLNRDWDPIGGCPDDEYVTYAGDLASMIHKGASDDDLMRYLELAEVEHIGLGRPFNAERGRKVVAALRSLGRLT